jgi:hypothetical protein
VLQDDGEDEDDTVIKKKSRKRAWEEDGEGARRRFSAVQHWFCSMACQ